jgi:hypothetical protein
MLAEIACFVNRLVSRYCSNTPQKIQGKNPALEKRQGRGTPKFQIRGWPPAPINFDRHLIDSWTELFGIEIVYVLAAIDTEGRTAIGGTHVIAFVEWRLWARQSGDWRSRGRALS